MSDKNQDKNQNDLVPDSDDELENLSPEERAAFEKIMAEITISNGDSAAGVETPSFADDNEAPQPPVPPEDVKTAPTTVETQPSPESPADSSQGTPGVEDSDDPQAGLDKIMAEIESKRKGADPNDPVTIPTEAEPDMSDDQQAALDKIMAEIESKRKGADPDDPVTIPTEAEPDMSDDQQAALDKIMAEIESKRKGADPDDPVTIPTEAEPDMSDDQQAALDKIMAEIESKRKGADPDDPVEKTVAPAVDVPGTETVTSLQSANLSIEEFDNELSQLLTTAESATPETPAEGILDDKTNETHRHLAEPTHYSNGKSLAEMDAELDGIRKDQPAAEADPATTSSPREKKGGETPGRIYPVLHEIQADSTQSKTPLKERNKRPTTGSSIKSGRSGVKMKWLGAAAALGLLLMAGGAYWMYRALSDEPAEALHTSVIHPPSPAAPIPVPEEPNAAPPSPGAGAAASSHVAADPTGQWAGVQSAPSAVITFGELQRQLVAAREELQNKISDIQQLKSYYAGGISQEVEKIENALEHDKIPSFEQAMANTTIELGLRSIQRRDTYITKLDTPLAQLGAMSEELLYLERRARVYQILNRGLHGLPIDAFHQEVNTTITNHLQYNTQLSIDRVDVQPTPLAAIWKNVSSEIGKKANLLAERAPLNRAIGAEICHGNFNRQSMLTALSPETALCLINWNGKDLYLNDLTELTAEVAKILSQWPGEWLSLNGLQSLSDEAAHYLSQWPGNRMSLNGLSELSPAATAHLSRWQGEQLEMVGLVRIGRWENYGTRLFLSETLRKQLEAQ